MWVLLPWLRREDNAIAHAKHRNSYQSMLRTPGSEKLPLKNTIWIPNPSSVTVRFEPPEMSPSERLCGSKPLALTLNGMGTKRAVPEPCPLFVRTTPVGGMLPSGLLALGGQNQNGQPNKGKKEKRVKRQPELRCFKSRTQPPQKQNMHKRKLKQQNNRTSLATNPLFGFEKPNPTPPKQDAQTRIKTKHSTEPNETKHQGPLSQPGFHQLSAFLVV